MSAEAAALCSSFRVGRFTATVTIERPKPGAAASAVIEWSPGIPTRLTRRELDTYRAGRNAAIAELSAKLGLRTLVVEV